MLALLQSLAEALRLYLVVKAYRARWDLENDITDKLKADDDEIRRLRDSTSLADRDESDRLLRVREARAGLALDFRTAVNRPRKGDTGSDAGRGVRPVRDGAVAPSP